MGELTVEQAVALVAAHDGAQLVSDSATVVGQVVTRKKISKRMPCMRVKFFLTVKGRQGIIIIIFKYVIGIVK